MAAAGSTQRSHLAPARADNDPAAEFDLDDRQRGGVQSIERAFAILKEVAHNREGIGLAALSKRVGLHNSTTFHLVQTMVSLGYIRQVKDTKRYRIGRPLFALAASSLDEIEMVSLATPILEELSRQTGESSHFAVRMGPSVVILARTSGPGAFQMADRVGVVRPAHCTALGKVILAALEPDQLERHLERTELNAFTPKSIIEPDWNRLRRRRVRSRSPVRCRARARLYRAGHRRHRHLGAGLALVDPGVAKSDAHGAGGSRSAVVRVRFSGRFGHGASR